MKVPMNWDKVTSYGLFVCPGSGWNGDNWLVMIAIPAHSIWPANSLVLRSFKTEEEARDEAAKMVVDIVQTSTERR